MTPHDLTLLLQFLNLPIVGGMVWLIFKAGYIIRRLEDNSERIAALERLFYVSSNHGRK